MAGDEPNQLSLFAFAYGFGFIFLVNGIHGGLRDLRSDFDGGRTTAAIFFGARPVDGDRARVPLALAVFAHAVHGALLLLVLLPLWRNDFGYVPSARFATLAAALAMAGLDLWLLHRVLDPDPRRSHPALRIHVYSLLFTLILPFVPYAGATISTLLILGFFLPLLAAEWTYTLIAAPWRGVRGASHSGRWASESTSSGD